MKALKVVKKVLFIIIAVAYFSFASVMTILLLNYNKYNVTQFGDTSLVIIKEDVSSDDYKKGDLVIVEAPNIEKIAVGDTMFCYKIDSKGNADLQIGTVGEIYLE